MEDVEKLGENDILVISSRMPMDQHTNKPGAVRVSLPSLSKFEQEHLFKELRLYVKHCSRKEIAVADKVADTILSEYRDRELLEFYVQPAKGRFEAAYYMASGRENCKPFVKDRTTAGYLISTAPLAMPGGWKGPRVLALFGVCGTAGIVLANQLRKQKHEVFQGLLKEAIKQPSLSMVEMTVKEVPDYYTNLDFADDWDYKLITQRPSEQKVYTAESDVGTRKPSMGLVTRRAAVRPA
jgi:hypothetical protein